MDRTQPNDAEVFLSHEEDSRWWEWRIPRLLLTEDAERLDRGWPVEWSMMPFPKPESVRVVG